MAGQPAILGSPKRLAYSYMVDSVPAGVRLETQPARLGAVPDWNFNSSGSTGSTCSVAGSKG